MPEINLTPFLNAQGRLGEIPYDSVQYIYNQREGAQIQLGDALVTVRVISLNPFGNFSGEIHTPSLSEGLRELAQQSIRNIYGQLWYHREQLLNLITEGPASDAQLQPLLEKIDACDFVVNPDDYSLSAEHLTCPITLSIPDRGVFVRTSLQSDVCCLYDPTALKELVSQNQHHPISREVITESHIVQKEKCHFDPERQAFILSASE